MFIEEVHEAYLQRVRESENRLVGDIRSTDSLPGSLKTLLLLYSSYEQCNSTLLDPSYVLEMLKLWLGPIKHPEGDTYCPRNSLTYNIHLGYLAKMTTIKYEQIHKVYHLEVLPYVKNS